MTFLKTLQRSFTSLSRWCYICYVGYVLAGRKISGASDVNVGFAISAFQSEGGLEDMGRTPSIWDEFTRGGQHVVDATTAAKTAMMIDPHVFDQDVAWMQSAGVHDFRFSVSWSRLFPSAAQLLDATPSAEALAYYSRCLRALRAAGIRAWVTLFHWDLPIYAMGPQGEWTPETVHLFSRYASLCFDLWKDDVHRWFSLNEPSTVVTLGYRQAFHAPGVADNALADVVAARMIEAHKAVHDIAREKAVAVGVALNCDTFIAMDASDGVARQTAHDKMANWLGAFLDPLIGHVDFIALNTYSTYGVAGQDVFAHPSAWQAQSSWLHSFPESIADLWSFTYDRYHDQIHAGVEVIVSEFGVSTAPDQLDEASTRGRLLVRAIETTRAVKQKLSLSNPPWNLTTLFFWSHVDNFEWASGFSERFGMLFLDTNGNASWRCAKSSAYVVFPTLASLGKTVYAPC